MSTMDKVTTFFFSTVVILVCQRYVEAASCDKKFQVFPGHTACLSKSSDATSQPVTAQEKIDIVNKHNELRRAVSPTASDMMKMSWDEEIAMIAQKWMDSCPIVGSTMSHDKNQHRFVPGRFSVGQNMAYGYPSFDKAIQAWYDEVKDYTFGKTYTTHVQESKVVGHYTQVVWAKSVKIGCGRVTCNGKVLHTCNYAPAGNVADFTGPYKQGTKAADCKTKDNGLCDCKDLVCWNGAKLDTSACTCDCGSRYIETECSLNCDLNDNSFCSSGEYTSKNCNSGLASTVSSSCPKMCGYCPFAKKGYVEESNKDATTVSTTKTTGSTQSSAKTAPTTQGNGSSTARLCFSMFILTILNACFKMY